MNVNRPRLFLFIGIPFKYWILMLIAWEVPQLSQTGQVPEIIQQQIEQVVEQVVHVPRRNLSGRSGDAAVGERKFGRATRP